MTQLGVDAERVPIMRLTLDRRQIESTKESVEQQNGSDQTCLTAVFKQEKRLLEADAY